MDSGQACRPCRKLICPIPGRGYFGDLLGDGFVVSPPSSIVEQLGSGDESGDVNESSTSGDGSGDGDGNGDGNEDGIGECGIEAKKRKNPHKSCRRHEGNKGDFGGKRETCRQERVGSAAANPNNQENSKEAESEAQIT